MRRSSLSPTARTLQALRRDGVLAQVVERFNPHVGPHGIRQDLFGVIDVVALRARQIVGVQCCAGSGYAAHERKILSSTEAREWLLSSGGLELWAWRKVKAKRGGKLVVWRPRVKVFRLEDFGDTPQP